MAKRAAEFHLTGQQLDRALAALKFHGYTDFFPPPPELDIIEKHWVEYKDLVCGINLSKYTPTRGAELAAPKSAKYLRWAMLLNPQDLLVYTAAVLAIRSDIDRGRIPARERRLFSFRYEGAPDGALYSRKPSHDEFQSEVVRRARGLAPGGFIGVADITDFYPRLNQHDIKTALDDLLKSTKKSKYAEFLDRFLRSIARDSMSYGIPVGPAASRPLAEAALIEIDTHLSIKKVDFVRYIDDFVIFGNNRSKAQWAIRQLGDTLHKQLGLSLQTSKTDVLPAAKFLSKFEVTEDAKAEVEQQFLEIVDQEFYKIDSFDELSDEQKETISLVDVEQILRDELEKEETNYKVVAFILSKLSVIGRTDIAETVLDHLESLYPVAHAVRDFFLDFGQLPATHQKSFGDAVLNVIEEDTNDVAPEYYAVWILDIFARNASWNHADRLVSIFNTTESDVIRRYAALAVGSCGKRAHIAALKNKFESSSSLTRSAIIIASKGLPKAERNHWKKTLHLSEFEEFLFRRSVE
jgi:hypothetical protein